MSELPKAIRTETMNVMGVDLEVSVLDDGRRVFEADSFGKLMTQVFGTEPLSDEEIKGVLASMTGEELVE